MKQLTKAEEEIMHVLWQLEKANVENESKLKRATDKLNLLAKDTARSGEKYRQLQYQYDQLLKTNKALVEKQDVLSSSPVLQ